MHSVNLYPIIGYLVLAVFFVSLLYSQYLLKKEHQLQLKELQEEIIRQDILMKKIKGEKEWLLQEIHHRVKNNLQIVLSLLNTQSAYLHNKDARDAIMNSQQRMFAISLIHQKLYQADNLSEIDMKWYVKELVDYLKDRFNTGQHISFILKTETIKLDVVQAVPLGLILNEAISNAIKYAFPAGGTGLIEISMNDMEDYNCKLKIKDNGIGLPLAFEAEGKESLGMSLINGLTAQLNGRINIWNDDGLIIEICFKRRSSLPATITS